MNDGWVAGLEQIAKQPTCGNVGVYPRFDRVSNERVMRPLRDFVTDAVDILERPDVTAVGRCEQARGKVRGPGESLHWLVAVAVFSIRSAP